MQKKDFQKRDEEFENAKNELKGYIYLINNADKIKNDYEKFKTKAEQITSTISDMPRAIGFTSDKVSDNVSKMVDIEKRYLALIVDAELKKLEILEKLSKVREPYRTILQMLYIDNYDIMEIAIDRKFKKRDWDYTYTCKQHKRAIYKYIEAQKNN